MFRRVGHEGDVMMRGMALPPQVQTLADQMIQVLGLQALRPESIEIHFDPHGLVRVVRPRLAFHRPRGAQASGRVRLTLAARKAAVSA